MKNIKYLGILILVLLLSVSCVEDEFGSLVGTWIESSSSIGPVLKLPPKLDPEPPCKTQLIIAFNKGFTGHVDKDNYCGDSFEVAGFQYNIKEGELTIVFDDESTNNNLDIISGVSSYIRREDKLVITCGDGTIIELIKE